MPNTWFTADFHFGHNNIIRYCNRPFRSVEEMDQTILERLNASVKPNDTLYLRVWNRSHHGSWHLYGHSHGRLPEPPTLLSMDVGVDTHDFRPWHYDEISGLMTARAKVRSEQNASPDVE
jgi:calcineurin-like phosphoesterase family protein